MYELEDQLTAMKDKDIAKRMRHDNFERFKALVRMHLSFELDLNTDEFDLPCHEVVYLERGKVRKWNRLSKKIRSCASGKTASPTETNSNILSRELIGNLKSLKDFVLQEENIKQEGVFRRTGAISRQNELRSLINKNKVVTLTEGYSVHDCATVYKSYLADLPEPLLTDAHYPAHCQIADLCNGIKESTCEIKEIHLLNSVQLLLLLLPEENCMLLEDIINMLSTATKYEKFNKMSAESLATLFTPHLICPRNLPPEALHYVSQNMSSVISFMIKKGMDIFEIPSKLATDIKAYYIDQKRKKTMSPDHTLDESISDISTVNTVYTFVDREKTAAAHNSNPTDTALAQLYAHIQSLPESSKKRKLIKQFNKENGQGTPLQLLMMDRIKSVGSNRSAKSISDSIKKHIFHKGIMSRTPKRSAPSSTFSTSNGATINPKLRVLFQSPSSCSPILDSNASKKSHKILHKSISSSSLLTVTPKSEVKKPSSAPVSRTSSDISNPPESEESSPPYTSLDDNEITPIIKELNEKKGERVHNNLNLDTHSKKDFSDLSHRYKSEPNLNKIVDDSEDDICMEKSSLQNNKLIKGISLKDLHSETNPDVNKISQRVSSLSRKMSDSSESAVDSPFKGIANTPNCEHSQHINVYRNIDLITSTPSLLLGRRSMSPITKSTQKMPKAMQESIMTPRSRKPVMLTTTIGSSEQNQTIFQSDLSSFREQDEDSLVNSNLSIKTSASSLYKYPKSDCAFVDNNQRTQIGESEESEEGDSKSSSAPESLTNTFREYLLSRSVLTTSPVDSSFSSHPDDFGSNTDIQDLSESQMSTNMLYFLDGNHPTDRLSSSGAEDYCDTSSSNLTNYRKRAAVREENDKENYPDEIMPTKKFLIIEENPRETSL